MLESSRDHTGTAHGGRELPKTMFGRFAFASVCLPLLVISAFACVALNTTAPLPQTIIGWLFYFVIEAVFVGLLAFSASGLIWCVTQAAWAEQFLVKGTMRLLIPLTVFCFISLPIVLWALFNA